MEKFIKKINFIDKDANECEIILNDGQFEIICFAHPYEEKSDCHIYAFLTENIMVADENECQVRKSEEGHFAYFLQGKLVSRSQGEIKVGKFIIRIEKEEIPTDIQEGKYIQFNCRRLDFRE